MGGTPQRVMSPISAHEPTSAGGSGGLDDLMGVFGNGSSSSGGATSGGGFGGMSDSDIMNGFAGMDLSGQQNQQQAGDNATGKKTNEDLLSLF